MSPTVWRTAVPTRPCPATLRIMTNAGAAVLSAAATAFAVGMSSAGRLLDCGVRLVASSLALFVGWPSRNHQHPGGVPRTAELPSNLAIASPCFAHGADGLHFGNRPAHATRPHPGRGWTGKRRRRATWRRRSLEGCVEHVEDGIEGPAQPAGRTGAVQACRGRHRPTGGTAPRGDRGCGNHWLGTDPPSFRSITSSWTTSWRTERPPFELERSRRRPRTYHHRPRRPEDQADTTPWAGVHGGLWIKRQAHHRGEDMNVLVGYASAHGSTREIAERLGSRLDEMGLKADVRSMADVGDADAYEAFVLGSAVHDQAWLAPAKTSCATTANYSVCVLCGSSAWGCRARCAGPGNAWRTRKSPPSPVICRETSPIRVTGFCLVSSHASTCRSPGAWHSG